MYTDVIFMFLSYFKNITSIICVYVACVHLCTDVLMCVCLYPPFLREGLLLNTPQGSSVSMPYSCLGAGIIGVCCDIQLFKVGTQESYLAPYTCAASTLPTSPKVPPMPFLKRGLCKQNPLH